MTFTKDPSTHPANGPLTEERLIRVRDELATAAKRSDGGNLGYMMADAAKAIDALLELRKAWQEPVACIDRANIDYLESGAGADVWPASEADSDDVLLYAAPQLPQPAVAVPEDIPDIVYEILCQACGGKAWMYEESLWNACRAVMLQAGNSPVTLDGYVLVPKELTCAMDDAAWEAYHETRSMSDIWAALLAAAPQQENV